MKRSTEVIKMMSMMEASQGMTCSLSGLDVS